MNYAGLAFVACVLLFPLILKLIRRIILLCLHDGVMRQSDSINPWHMPHTEGKQNDYHSL